MVFNVVSDRLEPLARDASMLRATGKLERTGDVLNVAVERPAAGNETGSSSSRVSRVEPIS